MRPRHFLGTHGLCSIPALTMKTVLYVLPFFLPVLARVLQRSIPYKDVTLYTIVNTASPQQTTIVSALVDPEWPGMMSAQGEDDKPEDPVPFWGTVTISQAVVYDPTATALSTIAVPTQAIGGRLES
ncbi:hypothetical protein DL96DRAFT_165602 [Flagelloscypha sp. PMI_526]|nr:hypothetical protein DL96DRAFT_165602 [Flagelloscypha sp. PMI_526]